MVTGATEVNETLIKTVAHVDVVLQTRLRLLRRSLEIVGVAIASIDRARQSNACTRARAEEVVEVDGSLAAVEAELKKIFASGDATVRPAAFEALQKLDDARTKLHPKHGDLDASRLFSLAQTSVDTDFKGGVGEHLTELDKIERRLAKAQGGDTATYQRAVSKAWCDYSDLFDRCRNTVFAEYVDLIRGVLIRDAGLDEELCRIADELGRRWGRFRGFEWHSVTIPAADDWRGKSAAYLIRIGFPEWGIWSVALSAYELGQVFAAEYRPMQDLAGEIATKFSRTPDEVKAWIADVFATSIMGPAFVWAAMLLRADPASRSDDARVALMLRTLAGISSADAHVNEREHIKGIWEQARACARGGAPVGEDLDEAFAEVLDGVYRRILNPFAPANWDAALETLVDKLEDETPGAAEHITKGLQGNDLRTILVAAWHARMRLHDKYLKQRAGLDDKDGKGRKALLDKERSELQTLADRTRNACIALIDRFARDRPQFEALAFEQELEPASKPATPPLDVRGAT